MRAPAALALLCCALAGAGCGAARSIGKNAVDGALDALDKRGGTGPLGANIVSAARDELTKDETRRKLKETQHDLLDGLTADAGRLRSQVVGPPLRADADALREEFVGRTRRDLLAFRDDLLGEMTEMRTRRLIEAAVGEETRGKLDLLRDDLVGESTRALVNEMIKSAAATAVQEYKQRIEPALNTQKDDVQKRANRIIWTLAGALSAVAGVAALLFRKKRRADAMLDVVTTQIHKMPERWAYDELTARISNRAKEEGVEKPLRERLQKASMLGRDNWKEPPPPQMPPPAGPSLSPPARIEGR